MIDPLRPKTRLLPAADPRVESGPVKFGDDWTGTFIRGNHAAQYAQALRALLNLRAPQLDRISMAIICGLLSDLENSREPK